MPPAGTRAREDELRREILEKTAELAELRLSSERAYTPGRGLVRYAGRVYDQTEMVNLVDSALDFWLTAGRFHSRLERDLAAWYGLEFSSLVNSGSSANLVAVATMTSHVWGDRRLIRGDEVITVAAGFPSTVAPIVQLGLVPVFVDVTLPTYNIDTTMLEAALSPRTRAVVVAHTLGNPFDIDRVLAFCKKHDLWLVEDNCDAAGSIYRGRKTGTFGDLATLSFYPPHHMTMGEGGAVLYNGASMNRVVNSFRDWGRDCWCNPGVDNTCKQRFDWQLGDLPHGYDHKYTYSHLGYNLKVTDMQAAVGVAQLEKLDGFCEARRANWSFFRSALADLEDVFVLPEPTEGADPSWFGFMLTVRPAAPFSRDDVVAHLEAARVQTRMLFAGNLVRQPAFTQLAADHRQWGLPAPFRIAGSLSNTDVVMNDSFWFGVYPGLTPAMRAFIVEELHRFVRRPE